MIRCILWAVLDHFNFSKDHGEIQIHLCILIQNNYFYDLLK